MIKKYFVFMILIILLSGCIEYSTLKVVQEVPLDCLYEYNNYKKFIFGKDINYKDCSVTNCFFFKENLICISTWYKIYFFDSNKLEIIRIIDLEKDKKENCYRIIATKKNDNEIYIYSFGKVYEYNYQIDKLDLIYQGFDDIFPYEKYDIFYCDRAIVGYAPPVYCLSRNSLFFTVVEHEKRFEKGTTIIKEFNLNSFSLSDVIKGYRPYVNNEKNVLYYISSDEKEIREMDLNTLKDKRKLFDYHLPIFYFVPNKKANKFVFIHRTWFKNFIGNYSQSSNIWLQNSNMVINFSNRYWAITSDIIFPEDMSK